MQADELKKYGCNNLHSVRVRLSRTNTHPNRRASLHKLQQLRLGCARVSQHQQVNVPPPSETVGQPERTGF